MGYRERAFDLAALVFFISCFISWKVVLAVVIVFASFISISFIAEEREVRKREAMVEKNRIRNMVKRIEAEKV